MYIFNKHHHYSFHHIITMLYHSTLVTSAPKAAVAGRFSGKSQEIITLSSSGSALELLTHDKEEGTITSVHKHFAYGQIRQIAAFRPIGLKKDYLLATSDSGKIAILEYQPFTNSFHQLHCESYGRSGVRRVVPGEYLAVDPRGRAAMIASVEKTKLVYVINRDGSDITISSPLEAHTSGQVTYFVISLDVGYENPQFASIEASQPDGEKTLVIYELDLGLNHVIRRAPVAVPNSTSHIMSVPGGKEGPGGVLVFAADTVIHHGNGNSSKVSLPRSDYDSTIIAGTLHQSQDLFFYIVQNQKGDLFKIWRTDSSWQSMYFGTIAVASSLLILKSGHMLALSELGDSKLYFFDSLGDDDDATTSFTSCDSPYISVTDTLFSRKPVFDSVVSYDKYLSITSCTAKAIKVLSAALPPTLIVASPLPEPPAKLWTIRSGQGSDKYIVLSYANATLVLEIGESVVETSDSGLILDRPTIHCGHVGGNMVQVHGLGLRVVRGQNSTDWNTPEGKRVLFASCNSHQVVLALDDKLVYFEDAGSELSAYDGFYDLAAIPTAVAVAPVPSGRVRSPFIAVACEDETVRIVSVDPESMFETVAVQGLMAAASSIAMLPVGGVLYLHMGLSNGVYVRAELDPMSGEIIGSWSKFIGLGRLAIVPVTTQADNGVLVLSRGVKSCLGHVTVTPRDYTRTGGNSSPFFNLDAISGEPLDLAHSFSTEDCPHGVIGVAGSTLKIFTLDSANRWSHKTIAIDGTAKRIVSQEGRTLAVAESPDQLVSLVDEQVVSTKPLPGRPLSITMATLDDKQYFVVAGQRDTKGYMSVFNSNMGLVHTTDVDSAPLAMKPYNGMLLVGVAGQVRMYSMGLKQLLRKAQIDVGHRVTSLDVFPHSNRIAVGDIRQSVTLLLHKLHKDSHVFYPLCCDRIQRQVTCMAFVDYETVAVGDRFGNFSLLRVPEEASKIADEDFNAVHLRNLEPTFNASAHFRFQQIASYHLEDVPTSISLERDMLVVSCLLGSVSVFVPVPTNKEASQLKTVEKFVAELDPGLIGRDHLKFRGYYVPVQDVVDGDLLGEFLGLSKEKREEVAKKADMEVADVVMKIVNMKKLVG